MRKVRISVCAQHVRDGGETDVGNKIAHNCVDIPEDFFAWPMEDLIQKVLVPALFSALQPFAVDANEIADLEKMMNG